MVERFGLFENIGGIGLRLEKDGEWVRHSDHLAIIGRIEDDRTDEHVQWMAELSALKKQVEELTKALNRKVDEKCAAVQARTKAESEAAALREERDRLNGCLNLANERTDENFDQAVKSAFIAAKLRRENEALRKALGPFANFAEEQVLIAENMWLDGAQRERIGDWFGPTAFADAYRARTKAEAEVAALRKALIEARAVVDAVTGHNQPDRQWSRQVRDRIDAALASTKETSDA